MDDVPVVASLDPGDERGVAFAGEGAIRGVGRLRAIQPEGGDRQVGPLLPDRIDRAPSDAHGGVHRHRERDAIGPIDQIGIPELYREIDGPHVVPTRSQCAQSLAHEEPAAIPRRPWRLGRDEEHFHAARESTHDPCARDAREKRCTGSGARARRRHDGP